MPTLHQKTPSILATVCLPELIKPPNQKRTISSTMPEKITNSAADLISKSRVNLKIHPGDKKQKKGGTASLLN